jgi:chitinase
LNFSDIGTLDNLGHKPVLYDLTFDYDFARVPRDLGNTQLRIDYSNEAGYWDEVVAAAASGGSKKKKKRSLSDAGYSRKRWLEEEYRDDLHFGGLSTEEFHKRWFGKSVLEWLKKITGNGKISKKFRHKLKQKHTAKIVEEKWECPGRDGYLLAQAEAVIDVGTSFGFTLIAKSLFPLDLSDSYLTFTNNGEITCTFTLDAVVRLHYDTGEFDIGAPIPFPGSALRIPGLATIGPQLALRGRLEAGLTLSATLESKLDVVSWEYEYRLPAEMKPETPDKPEYGRTGDKNGLSAPTFYAGVLAQGNTKAHLIAALEFGVNFEKRWNVPKLTAQVAADSWVEAKVAAGISTVATCPFTWGVDAGVDLYARADGFKWTTGRYALPGSAKFTIYEGGQCPDLTKPPARRHILDSSDGWEEPGKFLIDAIPTSQDVSDLAKRSLEKRIAIGPFIRIPAGKLICPNAETNGAETACEKISGWDVNEIQAALKHRSMPEMTESTAGSTDGIFERATTNGRTVSYCEVGKTSLTLEAPPYDGSSTLASVSYIWQVCARKLETDCEE